MLTIGDTVAADTIRQAYTTAPMTAIATTATTIVATGATGGIGVIVGTGVVTTATADNGRLDLHQADYFWNW
ncbi:hypothetical protein AKG12_02290 [Agrobacterium sp. SUL3]|nr:hypothetical protein AKG12_02290 [Agrobacterium sp. SUL3]